MSQFNAPLIFTRTRYEGWGLLNLALPLMEHIFVKFVCFLNERNNLLHQNGGSIELQKRVFL